MRQALLIAQLDAAKVQHAVLHRHSDLLPLARRIALVQRGDDAQGQMQAGAGIADLRAGHQRRAIIETGSGRRTAGALRDVLIHLAVFIRARAQNPSPRQG